MSTRFRTLETSLGAERRFIRLLPHSVLFRLPTESANRGQITRDDIFSAAKEWRANGILPYPLTTTQFTYDSELQHAENKEIISQNENYSQYKYTEHVIAWVTEGYEINLLHKYESWSHESHYTLFGHSRIQGNNFQVVNPTSTTTKLTGENRQTFETEAYSALSRITYLVKSLSSIEHTANPTILTRAERRSSRYPKICWDVNIRLKGSRGITSMKSQFAKEVKYAHTVRAHHRQEHLRQNPSGSISVVAKSKIHAHIRGEGTLFQLKDYGLD